MIKVYTDDTRCFNGKFKRAHTDMLIQREMDRLCIPKELLVPANIGASGNITASMIGYGAPVIEHPERVFILKPTLRES